MLDHLRLLDGDFCGFAVDRLTHSLQTAARAERAGRDDRYILAALLHDIGDTLGSFNHADIAAAIVKPFVAPSCTGWSSTTRSSRATTSSTTSASTGTCARSTAASREFDLTAEFCAEYDSPAFDPSYDTPPLEHYEPLVR